jgi:hypothetical protein
MEGSSPPEILAGLEYYWRKDIKRTNYAINSFVFQLESEIYSSWLCPDCFEEINKPKPENVKIK